MRRLLYEAVGLNWPKAGSSRLKETGRRRWQRRLLLPFEARIGRLEAEGWAAGTPKAEIAWESCVVCWAESAGR